MTAHSAIHVGLKQLGIVDDDKRDLYERVTGKRSLTEMAPREHEAIVSELRRLGFMPVPKGASNGRRKPLEGRFAKKLQALWIAAWNLGIVENRADEALLAFVRRQTHVDHVRFLVDAAEARKAIEALKAWMTREGGVDWQARTRHEFLSHDQGQIAWAQFRLTVPGATLMGNAGMFQDEVARILRRAPGDLASLSGKDWQAVMNKLGERIRAARRAA